MAPSGTLPGKADIFIRNIKEYIGAGGKVQVFSFAGQGILAKYLDAAVGICYDDFTSQQVYFFVRFLPAHPEGAAACF